MELTNSGVGHDACQTVLDALEFSQHLVRGAIQQGVAVVDARTDNTAGYRVFATSLVSDRRKWRNARTW